MSVFSLGCETFGSFNVDLCINFVLGESVSDVKLLARRTQTHWVFLGEIGPNVKVESINLAKLTV